MMAGRVVGGEVGVKVEGLVVVRAEAKGEDSRVGEEKVHEQQSLVQPQTLWAGSPP